MNLKNITLEMSLKPFFSPDESNCRMICEKLFMQWRPLIKHAETVSIMLWVGDGSEILEYRGNLNDKFEWGRYIGCINRQPSAEILQKDPECLAVHSKAQLFMENPPEFDYQFLKNLVRIIKETSREVIGLEARVGETFDPGPEFARSPFRYERHPEICEASFGGEKKDVISSASILKQDNYRYAGFPEGIPEGLPFGSFLGRQTKCFFNDLGFDFLWLSNGFGFGNNPWSYNGTLFDLKNYYPEKADSVKAQNMEFWKSFREECDYPIMVRGTNVSTGIDLASDGVPLKQIYESEYLDVPPVNSPWAAINKDVGIELAGWMSHIAELPGDNFSFRFYPLDPWWPSQPWMWRYNREPYDIFLPLAMSRLNGQGAVESPSNIYLLTIDNHFGDLPDQIPNEITPHLLEAVNHAPDEVAPLVWVYPFDEYHDWISPEAGRISEVMFGDMFVKNAINSGLPLNTVISTGNFSAIQNKNPDCLKGRILISPVPDAESDWEKQLLKHVEQGGDVLIYGSLRYASTTLKDLLGIKIEEAIDSIMTLKFNDNISLIEEVFPKVPRIKHDSLLSGGGIEETGGHCKLTEVFSDEKIRTYIAEASHGKGKLVWLRGTVGHVHENNYQESEWFQAERLFPAILNRFGWVFDWQRRNIEIKEPVITVSRNRNAFYFSGMNHNTLIDHKLRFPFGAPLFIDSDLKLDDGLAVYNLPASWHKECRLFVKQSGDSPLITCHERSTRLHGITRWITITGLKNAVLAIFPERGKEESLKVLLNPESPFVNGDYIETELLNDNGWTYFRTTQPVSDTVLIYW